MNVRITWVAPSSNNAAIDAYKIFIFNTYGNASYEETTYCNGSNSVIVSQLYCDIPMQNLRLSPYLITRGQEVSAQVKAHNLRGWGSLSSQSIVNVEM